MYVLSKLNAYIWHPVKDVAVICYRISFTTETITIPNKDNNSAGDYICMVTVSTVASSESSAFSLGVTGILTFK